MLISLEREEHLAGRRAGQAAGGLRLADGPVRRRHARTRPTDQGAGADRRRPRPTATTRSRTSRTLEDPGGRRQAAGTSARRAWAPPPTRRASTRRTRAGRTPRSRPTGSATTCGTSASCWSATTTAAPRCTGTSARAACTPGSRSSCAPPRASPPTGRSWRTPPTWWCRYGGSLSGEHGDGQSRGELLPKMFGPELIRAFGELKAAFDPDNRMNPGKVVAPVPAGREPHAGAAGSRSEPRDVLPLPARRRQVLPRGLPLRRAWASAAATRAG